jgi:cytochrome P450
MPHDAHDDVPDAPVDWDPIAPEVQRDQRAAYDAMRARCPVARDRAGGWTIFRHADVLRVLHDPETFSNVVSRHVSVPSGMDPPEHTRWRRVIEPYFSRDRVNAFEPRCRRIAGELARQAATGEPVEVMSALAQPFAARAQCGYLGWPDALHEPLIDWTRRQHAATLARDRAALDALAAEFAKIVDALIAERTDPAQAPADLTTALVTERVEGRPIAPAEITSILRNWTVGELGTIAASIGILAGFLAADPDLQEALRRRPSALPEAIDEILRLHGPLVSNRRTATREVAIGGRTIQPGGQVTINWIAANRDPEAFDASDVFRQDRDPEANLLYGAGIHVCPGAPLARLELRVMVEELLAATRRITIVPDRPAALAAPPAAGFASITLLLHPTG